MTNKISSIRASGLTLALVVAMTSTTFAGEDQPRKDDACTSQCDTQSDKCMSGASRDKEKQKSCDAAYDECLRKCG